MEGKVLLRCCLATLMISVVTKAVAVDGNHLDFSPQTPEAAAFQQVGDIPVGNYTGTMNLSIPLYTIECGDLKVPISLDYLGSAIHVDQEATWVGLNWMLNAGGAITTRLSNSSDHLNAPSGYWESAWRHVINHLSMATAYSTGEYNYMMRYKFDGFHPIRGGYGREWFEQTIAFVDTTNYPNDIPHLLYGDILMYGNGESPTYNAYFLGHHLSFIWDRLEKEFFITGNAEGFSISGSYTSPVITDGNGIRYEFYAAEQGYPEGQNVNPSFVHYDTTFYLTKMISPTGKTIKFNYINYGVTRPVYKVNETMYDNNYPLNPINDEINSCMTSKFDYVGSNGTRVLRKLSPYYNFQPQRLDNITIDEDGDDLYEMKIKFNLNTTPRQDIRGIDYSLNNIEIYKKQANGTDLLLKRFKFQYSYFPKNTKGGNVVKDLLGTATYNSWFSNDDFMYYRLKLEKVWEETVEGSTVKKKPAYLFGYSSKELPCKASAAIDYWGYFNNKENNTGVGSNNGTYHTLVPRGWDMITYDNALNFPDTYLSTHGADRRPDADYAQAGMLTSLTYPTGATGYFEYEANTFLNYDYFDAARTSKTLQFTPFTVYTCNAPTYNPSGSNLYNGGTDFTISTMAEYDLQTTYIKSNQQSNSYWQVIYQIPITLIKYINYGNQVESTSTYTLTPTDTLTSTGALNKTFRITLSPGKYRLIVPTLSNSTYPAAFYEIQAHINIVQPDFETKGAGVRIKSIKYVSDGDTITTNYYYTQENNNGSSGKLMAPFIFARQKLLIFQNGQYQVINNQPVYPLPPSEIRYWMASGDNLTPPAACNVCYGRVTVIKSGGSDSSGKSVYEYNNSRWGDGSMWDFMRRVENPLNGMLTDQYDYNSDGQLVHKVHNTYQMNCVSSRLRNAVVENVYYGPSNVTGGNAVNSFNAYADVLNGGCMMIYLYPSVQFSTDKITTTNSYYDENNSLLSTREVTYNQTNHLEALVRENTSIPNEYIQTEILYPTDYTNNSVATALIENHIINVPMEIVKSADSGGSQYVAEAKRIDYNANGLPTFTFSLNTTGLLRSNFTLSNVDNSLSNYQNVEIKTYNSLGKPRLELLYGVFPTTYVWGYKGMLPVAVVRGAYDHQVQSVFGSMANWNDFEKAATPTMTTSELYNALSGISGALVTIYEHDPYIGVTKIIEPNGKSTTYDYDSFGRLIRITDHNGIISNQFQYNYKRIE